MKAPQILEHQIPALQEDKPWQKINHDIKSNIKVHTGMSKLNL